MVYETIPTKLGSLSSPPPINPKQPFGPCFPIAHDVGTAPRIQEIHVKSSSFLRSFSRIQTFTAQHHLRGRDSWAIFFE